MGDYKNLFERSLRKIYLHLVKYNLVIVIKFKKQTNFVGSIERKVFQQMIYRQVRTSTYTLCWKLKWTDLGTQLISIIVF